MTGWSQGTSCPWGGLPACPASTASSKPTPPTEYAAVLQFNRKETLVNAVSIAALAAFLLQHLRPSVLLLALVDHLLVIRVFLRRDFRRIGRRLQLRQIGEEELLPAVQPVSEWLVR